MEVRLTLGSFELSQTQSHSPGLSSRAVSGSCCGFCRRKKFGLRPVTSRFLHLEVESLALGRVAVNVNVASEAVPAVEAFRLKVGQGGIRLGVRPCFAEIPADRGVGHARARQAVLVGAGAGHDPDFARRVARRDVALVNPRRFIRGNRDVAGQLPAQQTTALENKLLPVAAGVVPLGVSVHAEQVTRVGFVGHRQDAAASDQRPVVVHCQLDLRPRRPPSPE